MSVFEFNGRPFLLKADKLSKAERRIYELLAQNDTLMSYPCEMEGPDGERVMYWRHLSADEVRALLDDKDERPLVERVGWDGIADDSIMEYGAPMTPKRIAPVAHLPFLCSIIDEHMTASTYTLPMSVEDHVYLVRRVMDHPDYDVKELLKTRPDLYARITDDRRLPRPLQDTSLVLLTSAEQMVCRLRTFKPDGDEVYAVDGEDGSMSHICAEVNADNEIVLSAEAASEQNIENHGLLTITDAETFKRRTGAYTAGSILRAIGTMYRGLDTDLKHIAAYCDREKIEYIL